jgi:hypothetical protein
MKLTTSLSCVAVLLSVSVQAADEKAANSVAVETKSNSLIAKAHLASQMAALARENKDALLMLAAAKLDAEIPKTDADYEKSTATSSEVPAAKATKAPAISLFEQAKVCANGDSFIESLIAKTQKESTAAVKGRVGGPAHHIDQVRASDTDTYSLTFRGDELAEIAISGDGDTDLDLYIYDENDNLTCRSTRSGDDEYCQWTPRWTGKFTVRVKNLGTVYNEYSLYTN